MDTIKLNSRHKNPYRGINWHGVREPLPIKPEDSLICCDLRNCNFNGLDLSRVEFLGCRLNGTSFQGATLRETKFIGCFSADNLPPTDFRNFIWQEVSIVDSHLNHLSDHNLFDASLWPAEAVAAATETLSERNDVRYEAATKLGDLDNPVVAPILGCLLADKEWDVRSIALEVLGKLRHKQFPYGDQALLEWMFLSLGDSHSIVRQTAIELVETLSPPEDVLRPSIERMRASSSEERLEGLLAAIELCELDDRYSHLLDRKTLQLLLSDEVLEIRSKSAYLLEMLDEQTTRKGKDIDLVEFAKQTLTQIPSNMKFNEFKEAYKYKLKLNRNTSMAS
jgi:hypothetical protein